VAVEDRAARGRERFGDQPLVERVGGVRGRIGDLELDQPPSGHGEHDEHERRCEAEPPGGAADAGQVADGSDPGRAVAGGAAGPGVAGAARGGTARGRLPARPGDLSPLGGERSGLALAALAGARGGLAAALRREVLGRWLPRFAVAGAAGGLTVARAVL